MVLAVALVGFAGVLDMRVLLLCVLAAMEH